MANLTPGFPGESIDCGHATLHRYWEDGIEVFAVAGELDEADVDEVGAHLEPLTRPGPWLLDLREVEFLSVAGYRALLRWAYRAREVNGNWALLAGAAVRPYLAADGRTQPLPVSEVYSEAMALLEAGEDRRPAVTGFVNPARTQC
ncbi:STAS domain-containing protein [Mycolicibacterium litorale]|uniref:STAS domain-containing protein n=1 Tax=Mycolicibacterium litorale TaxID=758802 RepID=UPI003CECCD18